MGNLYLPFTQTCMVAMILWQAVYLVVMVTVTGSRLTGYIVNVMRSPAIERLMVRGSRVAIKHVIHDMVTRTLLMELRRRAIKRWVPCDDMDRRLKILHLAKVECGFRKRNAYTIAVQSGHQYRAS